MKAAQKAALIVAILGTIGIAKYWSEKVFKPGISGEGKPPAVNAPSPKDMEPKYPIANEGKSQPNESSKGSVDFNGQSLESALGQKVSKDVFESLFYSEDFAKRVVVTVDSATNDEQLSSEQSAIKPPDGDFLVKGKGPQLRIAAGNYLRYKRYADFAKSVDPHELVTVYTYFYPVLQAAYRELGNGKYFNDRVVEVIDHVLKTPDVDDPPKLTQPSAKYRYKFAEEKLEALSSSQKALVRMGSENERLIKGKLKIIRSLLVRLGKKKILT